MNKRFLIVGGVVIFLLGAGAVIFLKFKKPSPIVSPVEEKQKEEAKLVVWEDPAGFSFSYPENIEIDPHEENQENYAHLELTSSGHLGKILILVKDTNYKDIERWVEKETAGGQIFETELGGEPAKKIAYSNPAKLVTAAIDVDALVLIEMMPDEAGFWQEVYDQILSSFTFIPLEGKEVVTPEVRESFPAGGAGGIIEEPEEVIE